MNLKGLLSTLALTVVTVSAASKDDSKRKCYKEYAGIFIENFDNPNDSRFGCLVNKQYVSSNNAYCVNYGAQDLCYKEDLGNINSCVFNHREYNGRGCANSLWYLYQSVQNSNTKKESAKKACNQKKGMWLEDFNSIVDSRFACLMPYKKGDENTKYWVTYDGIDLVYDHNYGNMPYCQKNGQYFHSRGCALGLGYLYDQYAYDERDKVNTKKVCQRKKGIYFYNKEDITDRRYGCLFPYQKGDENQNKYWVTYDGKDIVYDPNYGNYEACNKKSIEFNSRGCAMGLWYLYSMCK